MLVCTRTALGPGLILPLLRHDLSSFTVTSWIMKLSTLAFGMGTIQSLWEHQALFPEVIALYLTVHNFSHSRADQFPEKSSRKDTLQFFLCDSLISDCVALWTLANLSSPAAGFTYSTKGNCLSSWVPYVWTVAWKIIQKVCWGNLKVYLLESTLFIVCYPVSWLPLFDGCSFPFLQLLVLVGRLKHNIPPSWPEA